MEVQKKNHTSRIMKIVIMPHSAYLDPIKYDADNLGWAVIKRHGETPYATLPVLHSE